MANKTEQVREPFPEQQPRLLDGPEDQLADISHLVADAQSAWRGITSRVSHQASGFGVFVPDLKSELGISSDSELLEPGSETENPGSDVEKRESTEPSAVEKAFEFLFDNESAGTLTI
jgi:hypothetical protein